MLPPLRSYLYVPGSNPDMIEKALHSQADALVLDLEDAVAPARKADARRHVAQALLQSQTSKPLFVRVNALGSGLTHVDIEAVALPQLAGVRLPKVESPDDVCQIAELLEQAGCQAGIQCLIESALGVEQAFAIAHAHPRVTGIALGEADLAADLGISDDAGFAYARSRLLVAARAAHLPAPVQSVYTNVHNLEELKRTTEAGKRMGFVGRSAIHPTQLAIINAAFTPTQAEVNAAQHLLNRFNNAVETGTGAFVLEDGSFIDLAVVESASRTLALAHALGKGTSSL